MKLVLLTSDSLRHKYIAASLARETKLDLIITEKKSAKIQDTSDYNSEDAEFISKHFAARSESEKSFFGAYENFPTDTTLLELPHGSINGEKTLEEIEKVSPDFIVLFGTSIIKGKLLDRYKDRIINLHLGLSPYYRGSATNLFPYYYEEPECVGATIHIATAQVDKGGILHQLRPHLKAGDSLHDIGNRVIAEAGNVLPKLLRRYEAGKLTPVTQKGTGRLCRNADLIPQLLRDIYRKFEEGLIPNYLEEKERRDAAKPLVEGVVV